jgi:hypothetical protein
MPNGISFNSNNPSKRILHFKIPYEISTEPKIACESPTKQKAEISLGFCASG